MTTHCVSLEMAKLMDKAGWKKPTQFYYVNDELMLLTPNKYLIRVSDGVKVYEPSKHHSGEMYPAPLATEILKELPEYTDFGRLSIGKDKDEFYVCYEDKHGKGKIFIDKPFCDVLAKMWLYLKSKKELI